MLCEVHAEVRMHTFSAPTRSHSHALNRRPVAGIVPPLLIPDKTVVAGREENGRAPFIIGHAYIEQPVLREYMAFTI